MKIITDRSAYHADHSRVSNSMLSVFLDPDGGRRKYEAYYVTHECEPPSFEAADLGTLVHAMVLEPDSVASVAAVIPEDCLTAAGAINSRGAAYKQFSSENAGKLIVKRDTWVQASKMADAVLRQPLARRLLTADGPVETPINWTCTYSGLERRCMPDKLAMVNGTLWLVDLKTTADTSEAAFAKSCANYGYHRQVEFYSDGIEAVHGRRPERHAFVIVGKEPPHICRIYTLLDDETGAGNINERTAKIEMETGLMDLARCYATGDWRQPGEDEIVGIYLPRYAQKG